MVCLACDKKGTHSIQALVSLINCDQEEILVIDTIKNDIFNLIMVFIFTHFINILIFFNKDNQGTHFIQKIAIRFKEQKLKILFDCVISNFIEIANNSGGVCVVA